MLLNHTIELTNTDTDVVLTFPSGLEVVLQHRPSNADVNYSGSFDIVLPYDQPVTTWEGDDMDPSLQVGTKPECRVTKQIVLEIPTHKRQDHARTHTGG